MVKGFSDNKEQINIENKEINSTKKGLAAILANKKFTYTLPGKRQINIFAFLVLGLNFSLLIAILLYFKNQSFHDFVFNLGR